MVLNDAGPWGTTWSALMGPDRHRTIAELVSLARKDPRTVHETLAYACTPDVPWLYAAQHLFLQRTTFSGKAVGDAGGIWRSPGFSKTTGYGTPSTERFGAVKPQVPGLVRRLRAFPWWALHGDTRRGDAGELDIPSGRVLVYLDPPYEQTTGYPGVAMPRGSVVELALSWAATGATVVVSEGGPVPELARSGWYTRCMRPPRGHDRSPFKAKGGEWVTVSREAQPRQVRMAIPSLKPA